MATTTRFAQPMSATLACVLGEAASGFVGVPDWEGREMYFVASSVPEFNRAEGQMSYFISPPFPTLEDAERHAGDRLGMNVFGPYSTGLTFGSEPKNPFMVSSISLSFEPTPLTLPDAPAPISIPGGDIDAIFTSLPALEKFAVPYYAGLYGPEFAQEMVTLFSASEVSAMVHLPWSEYVMLDPPVDNGNDLPATGAAPAKEGIAQDVLRVYAGDGSATHLYPPPRRR